MPVPDPKYKPRVFVKELVQKAEPAEYVQPPEHEIIHKPTKSYTGKFVNMRPNRMYHREMEPREPLRRSKFNY